MNSQLNLLIEKAQTDPALLESLRTAATRDDVIRIAAAQGIQLTADDLAPRTELGDAELDEVSGAGAIGCSLVFTFFCPTVGNPSGGCP